jgi:hypothetical protein
MPFPAGSYPAKVVADGAVAYWRLGETSGTTANDSIGTAHGTISGGVTLGQAGALADGDKAMAFDGVNDQVLVPTGAYQAWGTGPATIECWVQPIVLSADAWIFDAKLDGTGNPGLAFYTNTGTVHLIVRNAAASLPDTRVSAVALVLGQWRHLVGTLQRGAPDTITLYVDGVAVGTTPLSVSGVNLSSTDGTSFGAHAGAGGFYNCLLDECASYKIALTAPQIAAHYAARTYGALPTVPWAVVGGMALKDDMDSYTEWLPITTSDTADLARLTDGILVGGAGDVAAVMQNNRAVTLTGLPAGAWVPIKARRINATGTTATSLVALYQT